MEENMKKYYILAITLCAIFLLIACASPNSKVVGEYDTSKLGGNFAKSSNEAYAIGSNKDRMPVFKDTDKAFKQALIDYEEGFKAIQKEFNLKPISKKNWEAYKTYGWQLSADNDEEIRRQGREITQFFDIYENSFK